MTFEITVLFVLLLAALVSFALELVPTEVTALVVLGLMLVFGLVSVDQAIAGFSNKAVVAVGAMLVLGHALTKTGLLESLAERLTSRFAGRPWLAALVLLLGLAATSSVVNNTAIVALGTPIALELCRRNGLSPTQVLLPMSYLVTLGGMLTLVGTSTTLIVSALVEDAGLPPIGMFELLPLGAIFLLLGVVYVGLFGRRLLPPRIQATSLESKYGLTPYLDELHELAGARSFGQTVREINLAQRFDVTLLALVRGGRRLTGVADVSLETADSLIVRGPLDALLRLEQGEGLTHDPDRHPSAEGLGSADDVRVEVLLPANSSLIGKTLREADFRLHYGASVLALRHHGETRFARLAEVPLRFADTLLLLVPRARLPEVERSEDLRVLSQAEHRRARARSWWLVLVLFPLVIALAATGAAEILLGALLAVIALLAAGAIAPREAYRAIDWSVIFLIAAFVPLGGAIVETGAADLVARTLLRAAEFFPEAWLPLVALSLTYLSTSLLTQLVSNSAAALIQVPLSLQVAAQLGLDPRPFVIAVCFAATLDFMTPYGYQTNLMVYAPGGYRFTDYLRMGTALNLGFWLLATFLIPLLWPLRPG